MGEHEVHGRADGQDLRGLLVGHAHPVGVLELLHERVQIQRVGLEILLEAGRLDDRLGVDVQLVGQVGRGSASSTCSRVIAHAAAG